MLPIRSSVIMESNNLAAASVCTMNSSLRTIKIRVKPVPLYILDARMFPHANLKTLKMKKDQIILPIENFGLGYKIASPENSLEDGQR